MRNNSLSLCARGQTPRGLESSRGRRPNAAAQEVSGSRVPTAQMDPKGYAPPFRKVERGRWKLHSDMTFKVSYWEGAVTTTYGLSYVHPKELTETLKNKPAEGVLPNKSKAEKLKKFAELKKNLQDKHASKNSIPERELSSDEPSGAKNEPACEGGTAPDQVDENPDGSVRCSTSWPRPKSASARPGTTYMWPHEVSSARPRTPGRPNSARTNGTCTPPATSGEQRPPSAVKYIQVDWTGQRIQPTHPGRYLKRPGRNDTLAHKFLMQGDNGRFCYKWP